MMPTCRAQAGNISSTFNNATFNGNYPLDKGSSTLDQRHRLSVNWLWKPVFTTSTSAFAKYFVNGWELSGITTIASAHPVSATMNSPSTAANGVFQGITLANTTLNGSGGWNRVPFLPVGNIDIDRTYNVDARITRSLPFGERVKCNLSFEAFNAFNTIHNTGVQTAGLQRERRRHPEAGAHQRRVARRRRQRIPGLPRRHQRPPYAGRSPLRFLSISPQHVKKGQPRKRLPLFLCRLGSLFARTANIKPAFAEPAVLRNSPQPPASPASRNPRGIEGTMSFPKQRGQRTSPGRT